MAPIAGAGDATPDDAPAHRAGRAPGVALGDALVRRVCLASAAAAAGLMRAATSEAYRYAADRYQGGRQILDHSHLRDLLGRMSAEGTTAVALVEQAATSPTDTDAVLATKIAVTGAAVRVCTDAVQILGGYGYMREFGLEQRLRDAATIARLPFSNLHANLVLAARTAAAVPSSSA